MFGTRVWPESGACQEVYSLINLQPRHFSSTDPWSFRAKTREHLAHRTSSETIYSSLTGCVAVRTIYPPVENIESISLRRMRN